MIRRTRLCPDPEEDVAEEASVEEAPAEADLAEAEASAVDRTTDHPITTITLAFGDRVFISVRAIMAEEVASAVFSVCSSCRSFLF